MSWSHRFDNIGQRDWPDLATHWADFSPEYDTSNFLKSSLEASLSGTFNKEALAGNNVLSELIDDRGVFAGELVYTQVKANHAFLCAIERIASGNTSWGVTDAYHACMMLMRSIIAAFGIFICRIDDRYVVVDSFPWSGKIEHQKQYRKTYKRDWLNRAGIITCTTKQISQSDLFALFQRVINVSTVPTSIWPEIVVRNILSTSKTHFSSFRNMMIYGSRFWFLRDDLLNACLSVGWGGNVRKDVLSYAFDKSSETTEIDCFCDCFVLYSLSRKLHQQIYLSFSDSVGVFENVQMKSDRYGLKLLEEQFSTSL